MENYPPLTFAQKLEPEDLILLIALVFCFLLIGLGHNSFLGSVITTIVGFIVGRRAPPPDRNK